MSVFLSICFIIIIFCIRCYYHLITNKQALSHQQVWLYWILVCLKCLMITVKKLYSSLKITQHCSDLDFDLHLLCLSFDYGECCMTTIQPVIDYIVVGHTAVCVVWFLVCSLRHASQCRIYTVNQKKCGSIFLTITLANLNRFL